MDNQQGTDGALRELALFAGAGGGILGGKLLGWRTVCAVEIEEYARSILVRRQNDGHLDPFPIWDDVCTFDGRPWRGCVDVVSGGFPCQDISAAGKGAGIEGSRSGLWGEMARIIGEVRPRFVFVENSPLLISRGLGLVLSDLAEMGYDARWGVVGADDAGAPHERKRLWVLASDSESQRLEGHRRESSEVTNRQAGPGQHTAEDCQDTEGERSSVVDGRNRSAWSHKPGVECMAHGVSNRVDRIKALGNAQVPAVAALAWKILSNLD